MKLESVKLGYFSKKLAQWREHKLHSNEMVNSHMIN